jgi:hypothetical protein
MQNIGVFRMSVYLIVASLQILERFACMHGYVRAFFFPTHNTIRFLIISP